MKAAAALFVLALLGACADSTPPPPPPEPAFSEWCANNPENTELCEPVRDAIRADMHARVLVVSLLVLFAALLIAGVFWVSAYTRQAHLGGRFIEEYGSYNQAAAALRRLELDNKTRLAGALSINEFRGRNP